jgi:hypothetical protein
MVLGGGGGWRECGVLRYQKRTRMEGDKESTTELGLFNCVLSRPRHKEAHAKETVTRASPPPGGDKAITEL